jgi:hypothetical protein
MIDLVQEVGIGDLGRGIVAGARSEEGEASDEQQGDDCRERQITKKSAHPVLSSTRCRAVRPGAHLLALDCLSDMGLSSDQLRGHCSAPRLGLECGPNLHPSL